MPLLAANGIEIRYDVQGDGPWLVLSHSLACDYTMWDEQMDVLARNFRVLRYDTRGHGGTSAPAGPYTLELLAADLGALLEALGIREAHFVGLSMGGMIGQTFALRRPEVLRTLILCDTTSAYPPSTAQVWAERIATARGEGMHALVSSTLERWFTASFRNARPDVMQRFGRLISSTPVAGYCGCSEALVQINVTERLRRLHTPGLVVVGEHDPGTPVSMARCIQENLPRSTLAIIRNAAHISNVEQPDEFNRLILEFLMRHR